MNQVKSWSLKEVMSCAVRTAGSVIILAFHTASHKNYNCSGSSDPVPLKRGSLISSVMWAIADLGGIGGELEVGGEELTGLDYPAAGIFVLGLLVECDRVSGIIGLRCGVTGGWLTEGFSSVSDSALMTWVVSIS